MPGSASENQPETLRTGQALEIAHSWAGAVEAEEAATSPGDPRTVGPRTRRIWLYLAAACHLVEDVAIGLLRLTGVAIRPLGNRMHKGSVESAVRYTEGVWAVYRQYIPDGSFGRVCEVGPGDSLGMGVMFASHGAEQVVLVDRFKLRPPPARDHEICAALFRNQAQALVPRFAGVTAVRNMIKVVDSVPAEQYFAGADAPFDFICSNAVLEHLDDPLRVLTGMCDALAPGGTMVHIVDLGGHRLFRRFGPLAWLEMPTWLHRLLRRHSAKPNRVLFHAYKQWAQGRPGVVIGIRNLVGSGRDFGGASESDLPAEEVARARAIVSARRPWFAPPLCEEPVADLAVATFIISFTKPAGD